MESGNRQPLDISALSGRLLTANIHCPHTKYWWEPWNQGFEPICPLSPHQVMVGTLESRIRLYPLSPHQVMVGTLEYRLYPLSPHQVMVGTLESRIHRIHLYLSQQIGVRSSKTSQCGSANRPSVVPQGSPRVLVPF